MSWKLSFEQQPFLGNLGQRRCDKLLPNCHSKSIQYIYIYKEEILYRKGSFYIICFRHLLERRSGTNWTISKREKKNESGLSRLKSGRNLEKREQDTKAK